MTSLWSAPFGRAFTNALPETKCFSFEYPTPVGRPSLLGWSNEVAALLSLDRPDARDLDVLAGNAVPERAKPFAARYGGHQFGHWAGQLGDGRVIQFGDLNGYEVQIKGAGPTPYSRRADGRAVLRSSLREFVCSEAMHHLGAPTTRALAVTLTGQGVTRDMFYDGRPARETGATCARVAESFVRLGSFEILAADRDTPALKRLADFVIDRHFPEVRAGDYPGFFAAVVKRTAEMISKWMTLGFVHGVMNTDNLSVLGQTIDYGPFGWLEEYDPEWTPNTTDQPGGRYAFGRQPAVAEWNLAQFGSALAVINEELIPSLRAGLETFTPVYQDQNSAAFAAKLGWEGFGDKADVQLFTDLDQLMKDTGADFTLVYRGLGDLEMDLDLRLRRTLYRPVDESARTRWARWLKDYRARSSTEDPAARRNRMNAVNPLFVPRNYLLHEAIERADAGDFQRLNALTEVLRNPYREQPGRDAFAAPRPEWARTRAGCSTLSCSS